MSELPLLSGLELVKLFSRLGFAAVRRRGSHVQLKKKFNGTFALVTIPMASEVPRGTLASILRQAGLTREEFLALLR